MTKKKRGRPSKADILKKRNAAEKDKLLQIILTIGLILFLGVVSVNVKADQIVHKFKSPSFNGVNTSSHYPHVVNKVT